MELEFLEAAVPLCKYIFESEGALSMRPYPLVRNFTSHHESVDCPEALLQALQAHAVQGHALLKGLLDRPLCNESRASHTLSTHTTDWVCLDFDGFPADSVEEALALLNLDVTAVAHLSASAGIKQGLRAHAFFQLDRPYQPTYLKAWLKHLNLSHNLPQALTASGLALQWPLDVTTCQNDKILYIAPPIWEMPEKAPNSPVERFWLISGTTLRLPLPQFPLNTEQREIEAINALRVGSSLRKRSVLRQVEYKSTFVMPNPDPAVVTGVLSARSFTYLNLNGGDSWGYYHPDNNPDILYNFKGEPNYKTQDICPEYFTSVMEQLERTTPLSNNPEDTLIHFPCIDLYSSSYYFVTFNTKVNSVSYFLVKDRARLQDACSQYDVVFPSFIPYWEFYYNPSQNPLRVVDFEARTINIYVPSLHKQSASTDSPGVALKLIRHVLANDQQSEFYFLNWLAYIWQTGKKPKTAWVLHGRTGTGKGLLFSLLMQLFGDNAREVGPAVLADKFNDFLANKQLLLVDEFDADNAKENRLEAKLRNWITEDVIDIRAMRMSSAKLPSYLGFIFASNQHDSTVVTLDDRRYHIPPRQEEPLQVSNSFLERLRSPQTVAAFAAYLSQWQVDEDKVFTPMVSEAKEQMKQASTNTPEEVYHALKSGSFSYFIRLVPEQEEVYELSPALSAYKKFVETLFRCLKEYPIGEKVAVPVSLHDLRTIFRYLLGWNMSPSKFNKALARTGIVPKVNESEKGIFMGQTYPFVLTAEDVRFYQTLFPLALHPQLKVVK